MNTLLSKLSKVENKNKQLLKTQSSFIICSQSGNLLEGLSPFFLHQYTKTKYFSFKKV